MASRRCLNVISRHCQSILYLNSIQKPKFPPLHAIYSSDSILHENPPSNPHQCLREFHSCNSFQSKPIRYFSSVAKSPPGKAKEEEEDEEDDDDDEEGESSDEERDNASISDCVVERTTSSEEKEQEATAIGYKVIGPLTPDDRPFKRYESLFAVVQIGSHQFKVSNGDSIYTEKLKHCQVNDKLILNRVLMLGSQTQTIIGRPTLPDAVVHAVVEEHALDAKVIIFKKKRRKNYRRTKGHRQELTKLTITGIQGIEKPPMTDTKGKWKAQKKDVKQTEQPEKEAVAA